MIGRLLPLILLSTLPHIETQEDPQQLSLHVAEIGDNVTLNCTVFKDDAGLSYWYKIHFGYTIETITTGSFDKISLKGWFNSSRFSATKVGKVHSLTIRNVSKDDEATYFCQAGSAYIMNFFNGTILAVNDPKTQQKSVTVRQTPDVESVQLGDTVTLQCSLLSKNENNTDQCPGEDKVHWFRGGSESHPGVLYHGGIRSQEEGRCVYRLSTYIGNSADAGTYYCAIITCGEILFGEGTKVEMKVCPLLIVLVTLLTCSVLVNFVMILTRKQNPACEHCKGARKVACSNHAEQESSAAVQPSSLDGEEVGVSYAALDFPSRKAKRWKNKGELPESMYTESTYTGMTNYE